MLTYFLFLIIDRQAFGSDLTWCYVTMRPKMEHALLEIPYSSLADLYICRVV